MHGVEIDPKITETLNKPLNKEVAEWRRNNIVCPFCGCANVPEFVPPEGELLVLARVKLKPSGAISDPTGGFAIKAHICQNCEGVFLKQFKTFT